MLSLLQDIFFKKKNSIFRLNIQDSLVRIPYEGKS